jgi:deoxyribonuclease V
MILARGRLRWPRTVADARALQERLRGRVRAAGALRRVRLIAGADLAYRRDGRRAWAAVVLLAWPEGRLVEVATAAGLPAFPYVPGYLTFREGPLLLAAFRRLRHRPDLCLFDGQGLAHPRRFGLACHLGLLLDLPSIGCAKSLLVGACAAPGRARGDWSPIVLDGERLGAAVRTRAGVRPVFVSPGHRVGLEAAIEWVVATARFRVPEPIREAERVVNRMRAGQPPTAGDSPGPGSSGTRGTVV